MEKDIEFNNIISDIIKSDKFITLKDENHHGISRLEHSLNVSKVAYRLSRKFKLKKIKDITRAALLHDLYNDDELIGEISLIAHSKKASENALQYFNVNKRQLNAINAHMFPLSKTLPKYTESWMVTLSDKIVAIYEMLRYKAPLKCGTFMVLLINILYLPIYPK